MTDFKNHRFHVLDGMRGIAAIIVVIYHYYRTGGAVWLTNPYIAVDFFFMLSGFVIMHSYGARILAGMSATEYIKRRIIRLYPMMLAGIVIGIPGLWLYSALGHASYSKRDIIASAFSNLLFLPYFNSKNFFWGDGFTVGELFPNDGPLWSIFFELFASLAFIAMVKLSKSSLSKLCGYSLAAAAICGVFFAFTAYETALSNATGWGSDNFLGGFPRVLYGFSCGMLIYQTWLSKVDERYERQSLANTKTIFLYLFLMFVLTYPYTLYGVYYFISVGLIAPAIIWAGSRIKLTSIVLIKVSEFLGWISYAIYCLHKPVIVATYALDEKYGVLANKGISREETALAATFILAVVATKTFDESIRKILSKRLSPS